MAPFLRHLNISFIGLVILTLCLIFVVVGCIVNYRKLSQFKGPPLAAYSRLWLFVQEINARTNRAQFEALKKYGSPRQIGPNLLVTDDVELVRHMNAPNSQWRRSGWYDAMRMDPRLDSVFSTRDEKVHTELKAKEAGGYNGRDVDTLESDIDARILDMVDLVKKTYNGVPVDIAAVTRYFTLDVLSTVAFGRPFGFLAANRDLWDYNKTSSKFLLTLNLVANHEMIRWLFFRPWLQALACPKDTDKTGMGPVLAIVRRAVSERYGPNCKVKKDMLGHFVRQGLSELQCKVEAELQIVAGSDSTTTVLRSTLFLLVGTPVAYSRLRAELDSASDAGNLSEPVTRYSEAQKLPYLVACIWEGFRMYPPLFGLKSKVAPAGGATFKGVFYPERTEIAICDDAMCRKKGIFGSDSHIFRPDRWIEADEATRRMYMRTVDAIFGSGRFLCLGRSIAMMEIHKAIAELIRRFDWSMSDPMKGIDMHAHAVWCQSNMNLVARPRF